MPEVFRVSAVIVTFNPDASTFHRVMAALVGQVDHIIVVDNGSSCSGIIKHTPAAGNIDVMWLGKNTGIGYALNLGVKKAIERNPDWILTLDQDTILFKGAINTVSNEFARLDYADKVGVIGLQDQDYGAAFLPSERVITSGNLVRASLFDFASYRTEFFIDQVDWDFCTQVISHDYKILLYGRRLLDHSIGRKVRIGSRMVRYEPPERFYYIVRNSTVLLMEGKFPLWAYLWQIATLWASLIRVRKALAGIESTVTGLADGLLRKLGRRTPT